MAGTTVADDGQVPAAFAAALRSAGVAVTGEQIARVRGASKRQALQELLPAGQAARAGEIYAAFQAGLRARYQGSVRPIAGAEDAIRTLRARGIKVALNTGFDRDITAMLLDALGWPTIADTVVCGDDVAAGRPAPDLIHLAMARTGVSDPAAVANAGDTTLDLEAAARAGVRWNIGVLSGAHARAALAQAPHTDLIDSVADLEGLFR
jgi:phosphonatase-like hydrolase